MKLVCTNHQATRTERTPEFTRNVGKYEKNTNLVSPTRTK